MTKFCCKDTLKIKTILEDFRKMTFLNLPKYTFPLVIAIIMLHYCYYSLVILLWRTFLSKNLLQQPTADICNIAT